MPMELGRGAWCWFQDPRCVTDGDHTYAAWVEPEGEITIAQYDHQNRTWNLNRSIDTIDYDDHGSPAIHVRKDGRVIFMYMEHNADRFRYRLTRDPHDISELTSTFSFEIPGSGGNYPQFVDTEEQLYLFHRDVGQGDSRDWFLRTSEDEGQSWSDQRKIVSFDGGYSLYLRVSFDGDDRADIAVTPHPRENEMSSLFHGYFVPSKDEWYTSDGNRLEAPFRSDELTRVWDAETKQRDAWIWDIRTNHHTPEILYATIASENLADHRYHYSRFGDDGWRTIPIADTRNLGSETIDGGNENHYSPGLYFDHQSPDYLFLARDPPDKTTASDGTRRGVELERWQIDRDGASVSKVEAITDESRTNQFRPVSPIPREEGDESPIDVVWMHNQDRDIYIFNDFTTSIRADGSHPR